MIEQSNKAKYFRYFEVLAPWLTFVPFMGAQIDQTEKDQSYFRLPAIITRPNDKKQALSRER